MPKTTASTASSSSTQLTIRVFLDGRDAFDVETRLVDHNTYDLTRARHKWPPGAEAPLTWLGFIAWAAARRTGAIERELTWESFLEQCLSVESVDREEVGPTPGALGLD